MHAWLRLQEIEFQKHNEPVYISTSRRRNETEPQESHLEKLRGHGAYFTENVQDHKIQMVRSQSESSAQTIRF